MADATKNDDQSHGANANEDSLPSLITMFEPPTTCICPFGDVLLIADDGLHPTVKMRVSSCILAMTSKFFKVLFSPKFSEGQQTACQGDGPREVKVTDSPQGVLLLCSLLHHQNVETLPQAHEFLDLAILADKYGAVSALRTASYALLAQYDASDEYYRLDHLLTASYFLDQPIFFRKFSAQIVLHETHINPDRFDERCVELLPKHLLTSLHAQQTVARHELTAQVSQLMLDFGTAAANASRPAMTQEFMATLKGNGLWPLMHRSTPLCCLVKSLEAIELPAIEASSSAHDEIPRASGYNYDEWDPYLECPRQRAVASAVAEVKKLCVGACLDCVKPGDRECRVGHTKPWEGKWQTDGGSNEEVEQPVEWEGIW